jgi:hypothetical protein
LTTGVEFNTLDGGEQHWFIKGVHQNLIFMNLVRRPPLELIEVVHYYLAESDFQNYSNTKAIQETERQVAAGKPRLDSD